MSVAAIPESRSATAAPDNRMVSLSSWKRDDDPHRSFSSCDSCDETRFGFAAPDDCVVSLTVPAEGGDGHRHPTLAFELEFDPEQPDRVAVRLLDRDDDGFLQPLRTSLSFPAQRLTEFLSRRKATVDEVAAWQIADEED